MAAANPDVANKANVYDQTREQLRARLEEIEPVVAEGEQIRALLGFIESHGGGVRRRRTPTGTGAGRRTRGDGGDRLRQFVDVVKRNPGIKIADAAKEMGLEKANYLYRVGPLAEERGLVEKRDQRYFPAERGDDPDPE